MIELVGQTPNCSNRYGQGRQSMEKFDEMVGRLGVGASKSATKFAVSEDSLSGVEAQWYT